MQRLVEEQEAAAAAARPEARRTPPPRRNRSGQRNVAASSHHGSSASSKQCTVGRSFGRSMSVHDVTEWARHTPAVAALAERLLAEEVCGEMLALYAAQRDHMLLKQVSTQRAPPSDCRLWPYARRVVQAM
jgi:hypothetical protein